MCNLTWAWHRMTELLFVCGAASPGQIRAMLADFVAPYMTLPDRQAQPKGRLHCEKLGHQDQVSAPQPEIKAICLPATHVPNKVSNTHSYLQHKVSAQHAAFKQHNVNVLRHGRFRAAKNYRGYNALDLNKVFITTTLIIIMIIIIIMFTCASL